LIGLPLDAVESDSLTELLELLVQFEFDVGERIANEAITRLGRIHQAFPTSERYAVAVIYMIGLASGGRAAVAAVERLRQRGFESLAFAEAALRMVASSEPSALSFALKTLQGDLELSSAASRNVLAQLMNELVDRSDALTVLTALAALHPANHPKLFKASIVSSHSQGPFVLVRIIDPSSCGHRLILKTSNSRFEVDDLLKGTPDRAAEWKSTLIRTMPFRPFEALEFSTRSKEGELHDQATPEPIVAKFAQELGIAVMPARWN
jgi:hypothetical protein